MDAPFEEERLYINRHFASAIEFYLSNTAVMDNKRQKILDAAETVMFKKGYTESSIAEIARLAEIADSVIYYHFNSKEDLLFRLAEKVMKIMNADIAEQLKGIVDPISKIGKMIWFHLNYNDSQHDRARLLIFDCRSNKNFYEHESYNQVREHARILISILKEGIEKNVFRKGMNVRLVGGMIFALLDWEAIKCIAAGETTDTVSDFDDIMAYVISMLSVNSKSTTKQKDKTRAILGAAEKVFAEKGYLNANIAEIAKQAKVAEATIYEYFKNKEDLLFSISDQRFSENIDMLGEIFEIKNPIRKLRRMIRRHYFLYLTQRNFAKVFLVHIQFNIRFYSSNAFIKFKKYDEAIEPILKEGKKSGHFRPDINIRIFRNLLYSTFTHMAARWFILDQENKTDMIKEIDEGVSLLTRAVATQQAIEEYEAILNE